MFFYIPLSISLMDILLSETAKNVFNIFLFPSSFSPFFLSSSTVCWSLVMCVNAYWKLQEVEKTAKWWDSPKQSERAFVWPVPSASSVWLCTDCEWCPRRPLAPPQVRLRLFPRFSCMRNPPLPLLRSHFLPDSPCSLLHPMLQILHGFTCFLIFNVCQSFFPASVCAP